MKKSKMKEQLLPIVLMLILCISTGYAFLSSTLNIKGQASIKGNNFDVHFENIKVSADSVDVGAENEAKITNPTEVTFKAVLNAPGDKYEFTVDVVNSGTVDAMIGDLDDIVLTPKQQEVLEYSITYKDGQPVNPMDGIKASDKLPIKVAVNYKTDVTAEDIQNVDEKPVAVTQAVNYIQADARANFIEVMSPTMKNIGYYNAYSKLDELISYYPNLATVTLYDSINVPDGVPNWDISEADNGTVMAYVVPNEADTSKYDLHIEGDGGISAPINSSFLFMLSGWGNCTFTKINNLNLLNTSNCQDMSSMFSGCAKLTSLDVGGFDTSHVTNMEAMFSECNELISLNINNFDTSKVTTMYGMFGGCSSLVSINLSNFETSCVIYMNNMFYGCRSLTSLDLSIFNTKNVTGMSTMFTDCSSLTSLDLVNFDTSKVTDMYSMFAGCSSLINLNLSSFDTSNVTYMAGMFNGCNKLSSLDLTNFYTHNITDMGSMFKSCNSLTNLDFRNASFDKVTAYNSMFSGVPNGINIIVKDDTAKSWILDKNSTAVVKTVTEL